MENKPQIPTLKESQKEDKKGAPPLKIKGLQSGLSLIERLKQFKKKDLAFILAGLGVLFMAPLAEHFMMSPESGQSSDQMNPGFGGGKGGTSPFGGGTPNVYDGGLNGLAPGGAAGSGSDVITPLNVRDPSALVMGPNATQQPAATASAPAAPPPPPPAKEDSKWNDAIAAGKAAASAATKKAALPVPKVPLSAGGLRGLGAVSGGSGSSFSLAPISSNGLASGKVNQSNGLTGTSGSGIKGVARGPGSGGNSAGLEALKAKAAAAGGDFNRSGSASNALEAAASRDMSGSGGGGAGEGGGKDDKAASGSQSKDSKSPGESLEFLRQKMQMEKDIAFADELRKSAPCSLGGLMGANLGPLGNGGAPNLECNKMKGEMFKTLMMDGLVKPFSGAMGDMVKGLFDKSKNDALACVKDDGSAFLAPPGTWGKCDGSKSGKDGSSLNGMTYCVDFNGDVHGVQNGGPGTVYAHKCSSKAGDGPANPKKRYGGSGGTGGAADAETPDGTDLATMCVNLSKSSADKTDAADARTGVGGAAVKGDSEVAKQQMAQRAARGALLQDARDVALAEAILNGKDTDWKACQSFGHPQKADAYASQKDIGKLLAETQKALQDNAAFLKKNVFDPENQWQPKIFQGDELEKKINTDITAQMDPKAVNKQSLNTLKTNIEKLAELAKPYVEQAKTSNEAFAQVSDVSEKGTPWAAIKTNLAAIDERLNAVDELVGAAKGDATKQAKGDKDNGEQIAKWGDWAQTQSSNDAGAKSKVSNGYGLMVKQLTGPGADAGTGGTLYLAHADAQIQLQVLSDPAGAKTAAGLTAEKQVQSMLAAGGTVKEDPAPAKNGAPAPGSTYSGSLLRVVKALVNNPNIAADPTAAGALSTSTNADDQKKWGEVQKAITGPGADAAKPQVDAVTKAAETSDGTVSARTKEVENIYTTLSGYVGTIPDSGDAGVPSGFGIGATATATTK